MGKKGKHSKEKKNRINFKFLRKVILLCIIFSICIIVYKYINSNKKSENENLEQPKQEESVETVSVEEPIIQETVDTNVESLVQEIMVNNNLNENNFSFFYYNIEEKKYYFYNENTFFTAASTIKVPVVMLYYDKIREGSLSLTDKLKYNSGDYEAGDGRTARDYKVGSRIPISYLLEQTIVNSDNTATNILINNIGYQKCKEQLKKYTDIELPAEFYSSNIASASLYYDVLQYLYQNSGDYTELIEYMKKSSGGQYLKANLPQYEVAHKYGSYNGYIHDYGIIYGKNTYLVGVFTKDIPEANVLIASIGEQLVDCIEKKAEQQEQNQIESEKEENQEDNGE